MGKLNAVYSTVFFFIQNVVDLTMSPIQKELDLHVTSDGDLKDFFCCCCCYCSHVQAVRTFLPLIKYFIYTLKAKRVQC